MLRTQRPARRSSCPLAKSLSEAGLSRRVGPLQTATGGPVDVTCSLLAASGDWFPRREATRAVEPRFRSRDEDLRARAAHERGTGGARYQWKSYRTSEGHLWHNRSMHHEKSPMLGMVLIVFMTNIKSRNVNKMNGHANALLYVSSLARAVRD